MLIMILYSTNQLSTMKARKETTENPDINPKKESESKSENHPSNPVLKRRKSAQPLSGTKKLKKFRMNLLEQEVL